MRDRYSATSSIKSSVSSRSLTMSSLAQNQSPERRNISLTTSHGLLYSACLCWLYNIPNAHSNSCGHTSSFPPMRGMRTHHLQACYTRNLRSIFTEEHLHPVYFRKQVCFLFIFCSSAISFRHVTHTIYEACQKGSSSQYPIQGLFFLKWRAMHRSKPVRGQAKKCLVSSAFTNWGASVRQSKYCQGRRLPKTK